MLRNDELLDVCDDLIALGELLAPEAEGLELSDWTFDVEHLAQIRSKLSSMRVAIDIANKALAVYWHENYPGDRVDIGTTQWYVGRTKTRQIVDDDMFMAWLLDKEPHEIAKLFKTSRLGEIIKTTAMTPAEKDTHIEMKFTNAGLSIQHKENIE